MSMRWWSFPKLINGSDDDDQGMDISDRWDDINIQADIELSGEIEIGGSYLFHKIFRMMKENLNEKEHVMFDLNKITRGECVCVLQYLRELQVYKGCLCKKSLRVSEPSLKQEKAVLAVFKKTFLTT